MRGAAFLLPVLVLAGCGGDSGEMVRDAGSGEDVRLTQSCTNDADGLRLEYPEGWHTNEGNDVPACTYFHPQDFEVAEATAATDIAIRIDRESVSFARVTAEDPSRDIISREETTVAGRPAATIEYVATAQAVLAEGTLGYLVAVDLDGTTVVGSTLGTAEFDFERNRAVLDAMMASLRVE